MAGSSLFILSYKADGDNAYGKGSADIGLVLFYALVITILRGLLIRLVFQPLSLFLGIRKSARAARFSEQLYVIIYYLIISAWGLQIMFQTELWWFRTRAIYEHYPQHHLTYSFKSYYLIQTSFWVSQIAVLVLGFEKKRKDYAELVFHHTITLLLIPLSYRFHFTHFGLCVFLTMDISDIFLSVSKSLNYLESPITGPFFVVFVAVWIYMRHYLNLVMLLSVITEFAAVGPYGLSFAEERFKCGLARWIAFSFLCALQWVNLYWLRLLYNIGLRYVRKQPLKDVRSDDEDDNNAAR